MTKTMSTSKKIAKKTNIGVNLKYMLQNMSCIKLAKIGSPHRVLLLRSKKEKYAVKSYKLMSGILPFSSKASLFYFQSF
jgi:hypothetical protein